MAMEFLRDTTCGTVAGLCAKVVEFPFDTVKVRVQTHNSPYKGYVDCARRMLLEEGVTSFYRGIGAPMAGGAAENAVAFASYGQGLKAYRSLAGLSANADVPLPVTVASGMLSGFAVAHVLTPVELLKCRMQVENLRPKEEQMYRGVFDCLRKTIAADGLKGLFHGHWATIAREVPGNGAWFGFYNATVSALTPPGHTRSDLPGWKLAFSGAVGGVMYWTAFFPADVAKTRMQIDAKFQRLGLVRCLGALYREGGARALYSGWGITVVRAAPANAIIFSVYERMSVLLDDLQRRRHPPHPHHLPHGAEN